MIYKGLNDEEAVFLQFVAEKQAKLDAEKKDEETQELLAYRVGKALIPSLSSQSLPTTHPSSSVTRMLLINLKKKQSL